MNRTLIHREEEFRAPPAKGRTSENAPGYRNAVVSGTGLGVGRSLDQEAG